MSCSPGSTNVWSFVDDVLLISHSISPTWSLRSLTIQSVCGKLSTLYFIANLPHHYLPLPQALLLLTSSLTSSQTKFPNFISLSPAILLLHPQLTLPSNKIIKRAVKSRLTDHLVSSGLHNPHQSAYCKHHSTETALLYIHDHLINAIGSQKLSCLCLLDLSAAFDTIDQTADIIRTWRHRPCVVNVLSLQPNTVRPL